MNTRKVLYSSDKLTLYDNCDVEFTDIKEVVFCYNNNISLPDYIYAYYPEGYSVLKDYMIKNSRLSKEE